MNSPQFVQRMYRFEWSVNIPPITCHFTELLNFIYIYC